MKQRKKPELLAPAGNPETLKVAAAFGADAVYIGGEAFSLRAKAGNFSAEEMAEGIAYAHARGVKVYVTANILARNEDLEEARAYFSELKSMKPEPCDALIISDPGMFDLAREVWPEAEIHISTQANNTNYGACLFWHRLGARRVVAARELSLREIRAIRERIPEEMEIECFVHGAMCISYSGRCLLSSYFTGRDANQGECTHPCRWKYAVAEETRPGEYLPVFENERGTFLFNSRDLCMIEHIPKLAEAGIDSLKIEGRMKTALYVATVTRAYRRAIDDWFASEEVYRAGLEWYREEIGKCTHRKFSTGFYFGRPDESAQIYDNSAYVKEYTYLGSVEEVWGAALARRMTGQPQGTPAWSGAGQPGEALAWRGAGQPDITLVRVEQKNKFSVGDSIEIMKPDGRNVAATVRGIYDEEMNPQESAPHARQKVWVRLEEDGAAGGDAAAEGDLLRARCERREEPPA